MSWNSFPLEIHDQILRFFCKDIIDQYASLESNPRDYEHWTTVSELRLPSVPSCLQDISSASRVCHAFYQSIARDIKIDSRPTMTHLQTLQLKKIRVLAAYFDPPTTDWRDQGVHNVHVGVFVKEAGVFWRNPLILEHPDDISAVLQLLQRSSLMMVLPHLKEWVFRHATLKEEDGEMEYFS